MSVSSLPSVDRPWLVLVAGPYLSGTDGDPARIAANLERLEAQATSAQLAMLRYQLNPHFLFNTLNSISTLVLLKQTERANAMLARLSSSCASRRARTRKRPTGVSTCHSTG